jgi:hypothetical protein
MRASWRIRAATLLGLAAGCASLQQLAALRQVDFSLAGVQNGRLAGVRLSGISSYRDLSAADLGRIALAVAQKDLPLEFQVDVRGDNPTDNNVTARMVSLAWSLVLNDKETISGVLDTTLLFPPGQPTVFPMRMRLNLLQFFDGPAQGLVDLAASLAGVRTDPTRIAIRAVPTIETPLGRINYPTPVTIVSRTVGGTDPR